MTVVCYCGAEMQKRGGKFGPFYGCVRYPECDGMIGAHPDGTPLGTVTDKAGREARIRAHDAFDGWWRGKMSRKAAYDWLATHGPKPHIAEMDATECETLTHELGACAPPPNE